MQVNLDADNDIMETRLRRGRKNRWKFLKLLKAARESGDKASLAYKNWT